MNEFIDKISSYNIFNYLLPGALFAFVGQQISSFQFAPSDAVSAAFAYYFYGLLVSRIGSLIIEPMLKKLRILQFADYKLFVAASKSDLKLEVLSEQNNTYRSLIALVVCLFGLKCYEGLLVIFPAISGPGSFMLGLAILVVLILSYRKQTAYINRRIEASNDQ